MADQTANRIINDFRKAGQNDFWHLYKNCFENGKRDFKKAYGHWVHAWPVGMGDVAVGLTVALDAVDRLKPSDDLASLNTMLSAIDAKIAELKAKEAA
ncbi:hypothetical protein [Kozakia baliensis]|uniref:hypothetical protein n=1 Tax=Kozakia baliensis TaxID=153496 RepID=UPI000496640E|nr:hypothetical protein [Kozakia baliensis]